MKNHPTTDLLANAGQTPGQMPGQTPGQTLGQWPLDVDRLNQQAADMLQAARPNFRDWAIEVTQVAGAEVLDFRSPHCPAAAGQLLARVSAGGGLDVSLEPAAADAAWEFDVVVRTDEPLSACLGAQYAGWPLSCGKYFAMVSGPIRGARGREPLFQHFHTPVDPEPARATATQSSAPPRVAVLESDHLPDAATVVQMAAECGCPPEQLWLCVAGTASPAGTLQVVARSLETALHQGEVLGLPLAEIHRGAGRAPLPPVPRQSLTAIGWTNDAIIYHGQVDWWVDGDWSLWQGWGPQLISANSPSFGQTFLQLFRQAGYDFYQLDPRLFAPATLTLHHSATGQSQACGQVSPDFLRQSWVE